MAGQQQQILDTIFNMKRRLLRKDDSSDSDETDTPYNHRMQSLKRKAQYTRSGKPETSSDPPPFKKRIEHAGYHRYILHRNPPRFDPDGDIVEPSDEYEDEDDLSVVEENPYAEIKLEELLAPLTSAADLPSHPSYSVAYTSEHLTNLTAEAGAISRKEQVALRQSKSLFSKMQGDLLFIPTSYLDLDSGVHLQEISTSSNGTKSQATNGFSPQGTQTELVVNGEALAQETSNGRDVPMEDADQPNGASAQPTESNGDTGATDTARVQNGIAEPPTNGDAHKEDESELQQNGENAESTTVPDEDASDTASQPSAHRMTTRARAQAAEDPSPPGSPSSSVPPVHPLFTFPTPSLPDRDFGLPPAEAEDTRLLLLAFVQKQEEIARAATDLYHGMLQGERMRQDVFKWSKAEAHVGEMSDGEDWYDREEWDLDADLMKGRDEEDDDTGAVSGKKSTRQRRKPDKEDR